MVSPERKREAVKHLMEEFAISERRACRATRHWRSTNRYQRREKTMEERLIEEIKEAAVENPRYGSRRVTALLRARGWRINRKRVHRIWRAEGLRVSVRARKRQRLGSASGSSQRRRASRVNEVWSYDFIFDRTRDGRQLKILVIVDEYSRECLAMEVERTMGSKQVKEVLKRLVASRGAPAYLRSDNGSEFIAKGVRKWLREEGIETLYIEAGSPWQNAYIESFNSRLRDELLNCEEFVSLLEAKILAREYRERYNEKRPHSSLGYKTPRQVWAEAQDQSDGGCAPPNPAPLAAAGVRGNLGAAAPWTMKN